MSKLFRLKEWLTLPEAAKHLSIVFDEEVTESDVIRFALDRHLMLSVNLVNSCVAEAGRIVPVCEARTAQSFDDPSRHIVLGVPIDAEEVWQNDNVIIQLAGVWDLPMIGAERLEIANKYQQLIGGAEIDSIDLNGVFLGNKASGIFRVQADWGDSESHQHLAEGKSRYDPDRYYPAESIPHDAIFVVRTEVLREFEQWLDGAPTNTEKPLAATERNTLLKQIAALSLVLAEKSNRYKRGDKPNALQIAEATMEIIDALPDANARGVGNSSIRESIKTGLELLTMTKQ